MTQFQPKGDRSFRSIIISMAANASFGQLLTFSDMADAMGLESQGDVRPAVRGAVAAAKPLLMRDHGRVMISARGEGYRVGRPGEIEGVALDHRNKSEKQLLRALDVVTYADTKSMSDAEYQRFEATKAVIVGLHRRMNAMEDRLSKIEEAVFGPPKLPATGHVIERHDDPVRASSADTFLQSAYRS